MISVNHEDMVGRFAGWLMNFPALPNWVSMFHNSTGGSSTMSFTLQDHTFPVAWFSICRKCLLHSVQTILYPGLHLRSHLLGCLFLKNTLSPILKVGGVLSMVLCAVLKWFSSSVFLAMANVSLWASKFRIPESGSPRNHCIGSNRGWRSNFGSLPYNKKNGISAVAKLGVTLLLARTWLRCWSQFDGSLPQSFLKVGFKYLWNTSSLPLLCRWKGTDNIHSIPNCFNTWSMRLLLNSVALSDKMYLRNMCTDRYLLMRVETYCVCRFVWYRECLWPSC